MTPSLLALKGYRGLILSILFFHLFDYKSGVLLRQHSSTPIFFAVHARSSAPLSLHNRLPHSKTTPLCKSNFRSFPPQFLFLS